MPSSSSLLPTLSFVLPSSSFASKTKTFTPRPRLTKTSELPLMTLGHHNLLVRAREKLASVADQPGVHELLEAVYPYMADDDYKEYNRTNLELRELITDNEALIKPSPKTVVHVGDASSFEDISDRKIETVAPDMRKVASALKKSSAIDLLFITGFDDPTLTLALGASVVANRVCLRLSDYPMTSTTSAILSHMVQRFDTVKLYRPLICSPYQGRATVYVVAIKLKEHKVDPIVSSLLTKLTTSGEKHHVVDTFLEYDLPEEFKAALLEANRKMAARDIRLINELYEFVRAKDFGGPKMQEFQKRKVEQSKAWNKYVFGE